MEGRLTDRQRTYHEGKGVNMGDIEKHASREKEHHAKGTTYQRLERAARGDVSGRKEQKPPGIAENG